MKKKRAEMKKKESEMTGDERIRAIKKHREGVRERVQKCRQRKKDAETQSNDSNGAFNNSYSNKQTLFKASKVSLALPKSSTTKKAVLSKILLDYNDNDRNELMNVIKLPQNAKQTMRNMELITAIQNFFEGDDIFRTSPKVKDVKQYTCPVIVDGVLKPKKPVKKKQSCNTSNKYVFLRSNNF